MLTFAYCRRYVEKELSFEIGRLPERHDLSYYPTIHDLQNHIHKALQDIKDGTLPFTSNAVSVYFCPAKGLSKTEINSGLFSILLHKNSCFFLHYHYFLFWPWLGLKILVDGFRNLPYPFSCKSHVDNQLTRKLLHKTVYDL